jgi:1-acyl-sn-glycerol-3-phosphate acyltransferase
LVAEGLTALFFAFPVDQWGYEAGKASPPACSTTVRCSSRGHLLPYGRDGRLPGAAALCISRDVPCLPIAILGATGAVRRRARTGPAADLVVFANRCVQDGETASAFSERMAKEVTGLYDYAMTYHAEHG